MSEESSNTNKRLKSLHTLALVNTGIWVIALVALIFVIQHSPGAKGLAVILMGGTGISVNLIAMLNKIH